MNLFIHKIKSSFVYRILIVFLVLSFCNIEIFSASNPPVRGKHGMVVSATKLASQIGVDIMKKGGNAIDVAVAVGFALAVTYPFAGNIGGGGFMVIHLKNGKNVAIDYREKAPLKASRNMYLDKKGNYVPALSQTGTTSTGVPGTVAGFILALKKYGTMSLKEVIQPAIDLAKDGFKLNYMTAESFKEYLPKFKKYPASFKIFSKNGQPYKEGDIFKQTDLAHTLELIRDKGTDGFYKGSIAKLLVKKVQALGGYFTQADLEKYSAVERKPIIGNYRGYEIVSMPPPSSGGICLVEMLNVLENYHFKPDDWNSSGYIYKLVETMKRAYADRTFLLGDEDFYHVPKAGLISKAYAKSIFEKIQKQNGIAMPANKIKSGHPSNYVESHETTHFSVYDEDGNAVSNTYTLNSGYGSKIVVDGAGFLLNNEMDDFSAKPGTPNQFGLMGTEGNSIQPQKRPLSSMTPTIVLKDNKPYIVIGSPGGSTIITVVLQVIMNCIDYHMNISEAIDAPRIHNQWMPDKIFYENHSIIKDVKENLKKMGYKFESTKNTFTILGLAEGIMIDRKNNIIYGASDPRKIGAAIGF